MTNFIQITTQSLNVTRRTLLPTEDIAKVVEGKEDTIISKTTIYTKGNDKIHPVESFETIMLLLGVK